MPVISRKYFFLKLSFKFSFDSIPYFEPIYIESNSFNSNAIETAGIICPPVPPPAPYNDASALLQDHYFHKFVPIRLGYP